MREDITIRLRDAGNELNLPAFVRGDCCEGADEIERLRAEVQTWKNLHRELWVNGHNKEEQQ